MIAIACICGGWEILGIIALIGWCINKVRNVRNNVHGKKECDCDCHKEVKK
jgi:hypothetical protein